MFFFAYIYIKMININKVNFMKKNILTENMRRFGTKNLPLTESALSDDDILDIIMTYTKDPDAAEKALDSYRTTGDFGDDAIGANVTRDPRWTQASNQSDTNVDDIVDMFTTMLDDTNLTEQRSVINEGMFWTPTHSTQLAELGAMIGLGPVLSHFVLFGGVALAFASPSIKRKYESLLKSIKGRKLTSPAEFENFKNEMIEAAKNLPPGKRSYVTKSLNDIMQYSKNKDYERAFNISQQLITYLKQ
jgi:hypothetical protein